jgi:HrpA-like RNA helicase
MITSGTYDKLPSHSVPEILRVPLEEIVLQVKAMLLASNQIRQQQQQQAVPSAASKAGAGNKNHQPPSVSDPKGKQRLLADYPSPSASAMALLCRCPDVPSEPSVQAAEKLLVQIQALDPVSRVLTPLGRHLSALPCAPRIGRLAIFGALLGCSYAATCMAACMAVRNPFSTSPDPEAVRGVRAAQVRALNYVF